MSNPRYVGSWPVRIATVAGAAAYGGLLVTRPLPRFFIFFGAMLILSGVAHSSRALYPRWNRITEGIPKFVAGIFFFLVYALVLPPFALFARLRDPLCLRSRSTTWIAGDERPADRESLKSMG